MERPRVMTRFFSVTATYTVTALFGLEETRVKAVVRAGKKEIGMAATAAYGFEDGTQEITLHRDRPNAITLMLTADPESPTLSVHLLDSATLVELARKESVPVAISF
jgi:hypothetical protein